MGLVLISGLLAHQQAIVTCGLPAIIEPSITEWATGQCVMPVIGPGTRPPGTTDGTLSPIGIRHASRMRAVRSVRGIVSMWVPIAVRTAGTGTIG
jgi:hypothetical protein